MAARGDQRPHPHAQRARLARAGQHAEQPADELLVLHQREVPPEPPPSPRRRRLRHGQQRRRRPGRPPAAQLAEQGGLRRDAAAHGGPGRRGAVRVGGEQRDVRRPRGADAGGVGGEAGVALPHEHLEPPLAAGGGAGGGVADEGLRLGLGTASEEEDGAAEGGVGARIRGGDAELAEERGNGVGPLVDEDGDVTRLDDGAVAIEVAVGGGLGLVGDEARDDGDGEDVEVKEQVVDKL